MQILKNIIITKISKSALKIYLKPDCSKITSQKSMYVTHDANNQQKENR